LRRYTVGVLVRTLPPTKTAPIDRRRSVVERGVADLGEHLGAALGVDADVPGAANSAYAEEGTGDVMTEAPWFVGSRCPRHPDG
jgi:hypothetical protein